MDQKDAANIRPHHSQIAECKAWDALYNTPETPPPPPPEAAPKEDSDDAELDT